MRIYTPRENVTHLILDNGLCVSLAFGGGTYSTNRDLEPNTVASAATVEVAIFDRDGHFITLPNGDNVMGCIGVGSLIYNIGQADQLDIEGAIELLFGFLSDKYSIDTDN